MIYAGMAELADAHGSGPCEHCAHEGSSPSSCIFFCYDQTERDFYEHKREAEAMVEIRPAEAEEYPMVRNFCRGLADAAEFPGAVEKPDDKVLKKMIELGAVYLCIASGRTAGVMILQDFCDFCDPRPAEELPADPVKTAELTFLGIAPEAARDGLGTFMVKTALAHCRAAGKQFVIAEVLEENTDAEKFLKAMGFHLADTKNVYHANTSLHSRKRFVFDLTESGAGCCH
jgi:ribosomal protein S18 acetylase RimI-like enzyme